MIGGTMLLPIVSLCLVLVLVGSALVRRRLPPRTWLRLALLWLAIILAVWAVATAGLRLTHRILYIM